MEVDRSAKAETDEDLLIPPGTLRPAETEAYRLGEWIVEPDLNRISRNGVVEQIEPRVMSLLVCLARHAGSVVGKRDIIDSVWRTEFVSESSLTHAIAELRRALGDDARNPRYIETIPRRGYRLITDVVPLTEGSAPVRRSARSPWRRGIRSLLLSTVAVVVLITAAAVIGDRPWRDQVTDPPRIVVLPFDNLGGPDDAYFAIGMTEEITSRLGAINGLKVISRTSATNYDRSGKTIREIGAALGAGYVLEGSVRWERGDNGADRVRITPQLIRVADDSHLWSASFDRELKDIFSVQAEIGNQVVKQLHLALPEPQTPTLKARPAEDAAAYQLYLQGRTYLLSVARTDLTRAISVFERALEMDSGFILARISLIHAHCFMVHFGHDPGGVHAAAARAEMARALLQDQNLPQMRRAVGYVHYYVDQDLDRALAEFRIASRSLPNDSALLAVTSYVLRRLGRWNESLETLVQALEIDPLNSSHLWNMGSTLMHLRRYAEADTFFERAVRFAPDPRIPLTLRARNFRLWDGATTRSRQVLAELPEPVAAETLYVAYEDELLDRRPDRALEIVSSHEAVAAAPEIAWPCQCEAYSMLGRRSDAAPACANAIRLLEDRLALNPNDNQDWVSLAFAHLHGGDPASAIRCVQRAVALAPLERDAIAGVQNLRYLAEVYAQTGRSDEAIDLIERLLAMPSMLSVPLLRTSPAWDPLREHPRFRAIVERDLAIS